MLVEIDKFKASDDEMDAIAPKREDIATWFDLLDADDFVSFGGKA